MNSSANSPKKSVATLRRRKRPRSLGIRGERWLPVKDEGLQMMLNSENDPVRASSYVISILQAAGLIDVIDKRPNKIRLAS